MRSPFVQQVLIDSERRRLQLAEAAEHGANNEHQVQDEVVDLLDDSDDDTDDDQEVDENLDQDDDDDDEIEVIEVPPAKKARVNWHCPACEHDNVPGATACGNCREKRPEHSEEQEKWKCQDCNTSNVVSKTKCTACGEPSSPPRPSLDLLRVVTQNVSFFEKSHAAPRDFDPLPKFTRELMLGDPHVICLQQGTENDDEAYETRLLPGYKLVGRVESHEGHTMLFVKEFLIPFTTAIPVSGPAVLARIKFANHQHVVVGTCHFVHSKEGAVERLAHTREMLSHCVTQDMVLIAADFGIRKGEDESFEALNLVDAWKDAGADNRKRFTWNSFRNKYHECEFLRGRTGRYDRIYLRGLAVESFELADKQVSEEDGHYLSDHFGLRATVTMAGLAI